MSAPTIGRYQVRAKLGSGFFGNVYRAYDPQLEREVALKVPRPGTLSSSGRVERFLGEARSAARLRHPHIVPIYDAGHDGTNYYIASAYVEGCTLAKAIDTQELSLRHLVQIARSLAEALSYAHKLGIVHRDVKPDNIMLDEKGEPHLMDFGLAHRQDSVEKPPSKQEDSGAGPRASSAAKLTQEGAVLGTAAYMAPEQAAGRSGKVQPASDQYSLGAVLYELLCGQTPFSGPLKIVLFNAIHTEPPTPRSVKPDIPLDLEIICLKAMAKRPQDRYVSCQDLADDLRRWQDGEPIQARRLGRVERLVRWCRREPKLAGVTGLAGAAIFAVAILGIVWGIREALHGKVLQGTLGALQVALDKEEKLKQEALDNAEKLKKETKEKERQREKAVEAAKDLGLQKKETETGLATSTFERALALCEVGDSGRGLTLMGRSLELAEKANAKDLQRIIRWNMAGWNRQLHTLVDSRSHPDLKVLALAYSPDGKIILTGSGEENQSKGEAQLWDARMEMMIRPFQDMDQGPVRTVAFSPKGRTILTGSDDGNVRLWEAATGKLLKVLPHHNKVNALCFSRDGATVLTGCEDGTARLWETGPKTTFDSLIEDPHEVKQVRILLHSLSVRAMAFSPDGKLILTGSGDRSVGEARLWNAESGKPVFDYPFLHRHTVNAVAFSPDGETFVTGSGSFFQGEAQLWETASGLPIDQPLAHQAEVYAVAFSPDGDLILTAGQDRSARLWQTRTRRPFGQPLWHTKDVRMAVFTPDGRFLMTDSEDKTARLWEVAAGPPLTKYFLHPAPVLAAVLSPDGNTLWTASPSKDLATGNLIGLARRWDVHTGKPIDLPLKHPSPITALAVSPNDKILNGKILLTGSDDGLAQFCDMHEGKLEGVPTKHTDRLAGLAFSPDGETFVTASWDKAVRHWNIASRQQIGADMNHDGKVYAVTFRPDGKTILTGSQDGKARLWNAATGEKLGELLHPDAVLSVAFDSRGRTILTGYAGGAQLWDASTYQRLGPPFQHLAGVFCVALSPDGKIVLTGGTDGTARLWDAATKMPIAPPFTHQGSVFAAAFSPDAKTILTGSADKSACLWEIQELVEGDVQRIVHWTQAITGIELDASGVMRVLDDKEWHARRQLLNELGGRPIPERKPALRPPVRFPEPFQQQPVKPVAIDNKRAQLEHYLPADCEGVLLVDVRRILDSPLSKKFGLEQIEPVLKLKSLGLDPHRVIGRVIVASLEGGDIKRTLIIVDGQFDTGLFHVQAEEVARILGYRFEIHPVANGTLYEIIPPERPQGIFVSLVNRSLLALSADKQGVIDVLDKQAGKKKPEMNKEIQTLFQQVDGKHSLWLVARGRVLKDNPLAYLAGQRRGEGGFIAFAPGIEQPPALPESLTAGITIMDDVKGEVVFASRNADSAAILEKKLDEHREKAVAFTRLLIKDHKELAPLLDILKSVQVTTKGTVTKATAQVNPNVFEEWGTSGNQSVDGSIRAPITKYLPNNTQIIFAANIRQILDSPLGKKHSDKMEQLLKNPLVPQDILPSAHLNFLKLIDNCLVVWPGGRELTKWVVIAQGRFSFGNLLNQLVNNIPFGQVGNYQASFSLSFSGEHQATFRNSIDDSTISFRIQQLGKYKLYKFTQSQPHVKLSTTRSGRRIRLTTTTVHTVFFARLNDSTLVVSPHQELVIEALDMEAGIKKSELNEEFQTLAQEFERKHSLWFAVQKRQNQSLRRLVENLPFETFLSGFEHIIIDNESENIGGGITVGDDLKAEVFTTSKNRDSTKELTKKLEEVLSQTKEFIGFLGQELKESGPLSDILKTVKVTSEGKVITVAGHVTSNVLEEWAKLGKQPAGESIRPPLSKYLPNDTQIVFAANVRQILDSPLGKKYSRLIEVLQNQLLFSQFSQLQVFVDKSWWKVIDTFIVALPDGNDLTKGVVIVQGQFIFSNLLSKLGTIISHGGNGNFKTHFERDPLGKPRLIISDSVNHSTYQIDIHQLADYHVYEISHDRLSPAMFVAGLNNSTIVASGVKENVIEALDKEAGKKKSEINKELQTLVQRFESKRSLWLAGLSSAFPVALIRQFPIPYLELIIEKTTAISAQIIVASDLNCELVFTSKNGNAAMELKNTFDKDLDQAKQQLPAPWLEILKTVKITTQGQVVTITGHTTSDVIDEYAGFIGLLERP